MNSPKNFPWFAWFRSCHFFPGNHFSSILILGLAGSGDKMKKKEAARGTPNLSNGRKENLMNYYWENNTCAQANVEIAKVFEIMDNKSSTISGM